jgi:1-acyl-sn-glycerol-3-phosphate acyltransferase
MRDIVYPPVIALARASFVGLGLTFTISGTANVPRSGGAVMAINHTGYLDFTFAGLAAHPSKRLVRFMAKDAIFRNPVAGPLMRGMHHISVDREAGAASYHDAVEALRRGEIVGVFPEATMSPSYELLPFKQGAARMALEAGVPLLPTVLWASHRAGTYHRRKPLLQRRLPITITVGELMPAEEGEGVAALTRRLRAVMTDMLHTAQETYPDHPSDPGEDWWLPARLGGSAPTPEEGQALANARRRKREDASAKAAAAQEKSGSDGA